jgi:hypothetical protein
MVMRVVAFLAAVLMVGVTLTACTSDAAPTDRATTKVDAKGFTLKVDGVTASAPAGFAKQGGQVSLTRIKTFAADANSKLVKSAGPSVRVALAKGVSPNKPVTFKFKIDKSAISGRDNVFAVLMRTTNSSVVTPVKGALDEKTGLMTIRQVDLARVNPSAARSSDGQGSAIQLAADRRTSAGLGDFFADLTPVLFSVGDFADKIQKTLSVTFKASFPGPKNCRTEVDLGGGKYSTPPVGDGSIVPCLSLSSDKSKVVAELFSTKGIPAYVTSKPDGFEPTTGIATTPNDVAVRVVVNAIQGQRAAELYGGESLKFQFNNDKPIQSLKYTNDFLTMMTLYAAQVFETILENGEKTIDLATREKTLSAAVQCFVDAKDIKGVTDPVDAAGTILKGMSTCISVLPLAGAAWGLIVMLPQVVLNSINLIVEEATGYKTGTIEIKQIAKPIASVKLADYLAYSEGPYYRYAFSSPDGNLVCGISQGEDSSPWGCFTYRHTWSDPKLPNEIDAAGNCEALDQVRQLGAMFAAYPGGPFTESCLPKNSEADLTGKVLPYNSKISVRGVTCTSLRVDGASQMKCRAPTGSYLTISKSTMTYKDGTAR